MPTLEKAATTFTDGFYHFGLLPASGKILFPKPDKNNNGKVSLVEVDAASCWTNSESAVGDSSTQIFIAKARQFLGISVRGCAFSTTSEYVEMGKEGAMRIAFPGSVAYFTADQAEAIVKSCNQHFIRHKNGVASEGHPDAPVQLVDMEFGTPADYEKTGMDAADWKKAKADGKAMSASLLYDGGNTFNKKTDKLVSEYVYFKRLDVDEEKLEPSFWAEYKKNPNRHNFGFVKERLTESFFSKPPKSVAEMYKNLSA